MPYCRSFFAFLLGCLFATSFVVAQTGLTSTSAVQRDPQALTIVAQALNAGGGMNPLAAIQDFTGSGTIDYFWAGEDVQGSVSVKGRGTGQFRLDANLADGIRSSVVSNGAGSLKETDGTIRRVAPHNAINSGSLTLPWVQLIAALQDPSLSISYLGLVTKDGQQVHDIRLRKVFAADSDPGGTRGKMTTRDFFIDPSTFQVLRTLDALHSPHDATEDYPHEMVYSDYRPVNGVLVPFSITEMVGGQRTLKIQLDQITFNAGLTDSDFQVQDVLELVEQ